MDGRAVSELRELERRDAELATRVDRLRSLDGEVTAIRARTEEIETFRGLRSVERKRREEAVAEARAELDRRASAAAEAFVTVERENDETARRLATLALGRANDHVVVARARLSRAERAFAELEEIAAAIPGELAELASRAHAVALEVADVPAPENEAGLTEWASRAHAALFVSQRQLEAVRERLIREANELASSLLGEPTYGSTTAQARARVEAVL